MRVVNLIVGLMMIVSTHQVYSQKQWTLKDCIEYAIENNIQVKQNQVQLKQGETQLNTAKNSRLPALNAGLSGTGSFGQSMNRYGVYQDQNSSSAGINLNLSLPVYQGSRIKHQIESADMSLQSTQAQYESTKEDLSLSITSKYVEVLYNKRLLEVANNQSAISQELVNKSKIQMDNGKVSKSSYYEAVSVAANDKYSVTNSKNSLELSLLSLTQLLNLPASESFDIAEPDASLIDAMAASEIVDPTTVYNYSVAYRPSVLMQQLRLKSYQSDLRVAKSVFVPTVSFSAGYSNSYYYSFSDATMNTSFGDQLSTNGRESIGLNISIPIFNRFQNRNNVTLSTLNIRNQELALEDTKLKLREEIERAYLNSVTSQQNYIASKDAYQAASIAFDFEKEKSDAGRSTIFDFNDSKNRLVKAEADMARAKYQFLFNKKILDFYNGVPLVD